MSGDLIDRAIALAREAHADQTRKGTGESYFDGHLEPVARLVAESGGSEVQIAASYLHDAAEDAGGPTMLARIDDELGPQVAAMVEHLSDSLIDTTSGVDKEDWATRKRRYLAGLADAPRDALEVSVADKLHNALSILADYHQLGPEVWKRFSERRPQCQLWYYTTLAETFSDRIPEHPLTGRVAQCVEAVVDRTREDVPEIDVLLAEIRRDHQGAPDEREPQA